GGGSGRGCGRRGGARERDRDRDQREDQPQGGQQQPPVPHVAVEVVQERRCLDLLHGVVVGGGEPGTGLDVGVEVAVEAGVVIAGAGAVGVAPAVIPWSAGGRAVGPVRWG